jgi:4-hydroxy-3-methylbut-2-enyl diphosphate reductase IspH
VAENIKIFTSHCIKSHVTEIILTHSLHKIDNACPDVSAPTTDLNEILLKAK